MTKLALVVAAAVGCADAPVEDCTITMSGDVTLTTSCRSFWCTSELGQELDVSIGRSPDQMLNWTMRPSLDAPDSFEQGSYDLTQLSSRSEFIVQVNATTYQARAIASRHPDEEVSFQVFTTFGQPDCQGFIASSLAASLVEVTQTPDGPVVGAGRVRASVYVRDR